MPYQTAPLRLRRLALAVTLLSGSPVCGESITPGLVQTTSPDRVSGATPSFELSRTPASDRHRAATVDDHVDDGLRPWLYPAPATSFDRIATGGGLVSEDATTDIGPPRLNRFVELEADVEELPAEVDSPTLGEIDVLLQTDGGAPVRKNPLVADKPPRLRKFSLNDRPVWAPAPSTADSEPRLAECAIERDYTTTPAPQSTSNGVDQTEPSQYGLMAIDCIGDHLQPSETDDASQLSALPERLPNDQLLLEPSNEGDWRTNEVRQPLEDDALLLSEDPELPNPYRFDPNGPAAREVDELLSIEQESGQTESVPSDSNAKQGTLTERWASWKRKLGLPAGKVATQAASARRPIAETSSTQSTKPKQTSHGILNHWFKKYR